MPTRSPSPSLDRAAFRSVLDPYRGLRDDPPVREGGWLASVALVLRPAPNVPEILLIRRSTDEQDPWSGHMALPGGRKDPADTSLLHTALRETREEVALELEREGEPLGRLGIVAPRTPHLPPITVAPFVFGVPGTAAARPASPEVREVHWVSLGHFRDPTARSTVRPPGLEEGLSFPAYDVAGQPVWGLTHRILADLLERLRRA
jgi:8-oxo-dGTP pyrophosphatase MutT (NUDIX family)